MTNMPAPLEKKRPFDTFEVVVEAVSELSPRNKGLRFKLPEGKSMVFKAGQFVQVFVPQEDQTRRTSYSIASSPRETTAFELCVTKVDGGVSSNYLHSLLPGDRVKILGPLGHFSMKDLVTPAVFLSTGSGIAPFRAMILDRLASGDPQSLLLLFGNRFEEDILYRAEWEALAKKYPQFRVVHTLSRGDWPGEKGYVGDKIEKFVPDVSHTNFYICGLVKMINDVQAKLRSLGVPDSAILFERYD